MLEIHKGGKASGRCLRNLTFRTEKGSGAILFGTRVALVHRLDLIVGGMPSDFKSVTQRRRVRRSIDVSGVALRGASSFSPAV
jgi:hypothetical protein